MLIGISVNTRPNALSKYPTKNNINTALVQTYEVESLNYVHGMLLMCYVLWNVKQHGDFRKSSPAFGWVTESNE
jgi:hypothetical protein